MTNKKTILHIIDTLARGGAETMLVSVEKRLTDYNNIIVLLKNENQFENEVDESKIHSLDLQSYWQLPKAITQLRKIIKDNKVDIVHSHLFLSTVIARFATPRNIPLVTTIHTFPADSIDYKPLRMRLIENITFRYRKNAIIGVAKGSLQQYINLVKKQPYKSYFLYTFVDINKFDINNVSVTPHQPDKFKMVSVGNFKEQKNQEFLLNCFKDLEDVNISLDIYGAGPLKDHLQSIIDKNNLNITLKGQVKNVHEKLPEYDLFVMSSKYEGFALSVLEAMAMKVPLFVSDIASFKEQCDDCAFYFSLNDTSNFVEKLTLLKNNKDELASKANAANTRVKNMFTLDMHIKKLKEIYSDLLSN